MPIYTQIKERDNMIKGLYDMMINKGYKDEECKIRLALFTSIPYNIINDIINYTK